MGHELPRFAEIADMRCQEASHGTKTINVKVAINTARMMVEAELQEHKNYRLAVEALRMAMHQVTKPEDCRSIQNILVKLGEIK